MAVECCTPKPVHVILAIKGGKKVEKKGMGGLAGRQRQKHDMEKEKNRENELSRKRGRTWKPMWFLPFRCTPRPGPMEAAGKDFWGLKY